MHANLGDDDDNHAPQLVRPNPGLDLATNSGRSRPPLTELSAHSGNVFGAPASSSASAPIPCRNTFEPLLSDCHQEVEMTSAPSAPSFTSHRNVTQGPKHVEIHIAAWNIGGTSVEDAIQSTRRTAGPKKDLVCLQEVPRQPTGWKTDTVDGMTIVQYRHDDGQWRGNAIAFTEDYQILRRRGCRFGIWLRLRHLPTENEMWISSIRLSTGTTSDVTAEELRTVCALLPPTLLPTVMMGDFNTQLKWSRIAGAQGDMRPTEARAEYVLSQLGGCGMRMKAPGPDQWDTPTSRPRRARARGRQIDGVAYKGARLTDVIIEVDSFKQLIGGDHERLYTSFLVRTGDRAVPQRVPTRPRIVVRQLPSVESFDQQILHQLAVQYTQPKPGTRYRDTPLVKQLYRQAKRTGTENDWKTAHKARRKAQVQWRTSKLEQAAAGSWQEYRNLKTVGGSEWSVHYVQAAEDNKQDPMKWTIGHFRTLFQKTGPRSPPQWNKDVDTGLHFSLDELRHAVSKGKTNKSVGEDLVSFELIRALCEDPTTEQSFLGWMERLRCGEELPAEWLRTVVTLLPKTEKPRGPGDLRPISVGAAAAKVFGTMLLLRTRQHLMPCGPAQCAHSGRQTADYLFAAVKTFSLDTEWKLGLSWCRIDTRKAFDTLSRDRTLQVLRDRLPPCMFLEYRCWERLFHEGTALIRTPWGDAAVPQGRGIRQGSVESPFLFAVAVETALYDAMRQPTWPRRIPSAPDMPLAELLFMDDTLLCAGSRDAMVLKYDLLREELLKWGLRVNPEKTAYYHSPHSTTPGPIRLGDETITPAENLSVFGVPLAVPLKPTGLMDSAMAKASKKFYSNLQMFTARAPLQGKLQMFRSVVGGSALWYCSAISPTPQAMSSLNTLQMELLAKTAGFRRRSQETWLDFRTRSLRGARSLMHSQGVERWSTCWLQRFWAYKGHIARALEREQPPASSILDAYRTLAWWRDQQRRPDGLSHRGSFYAYHTFEEQSFNRACSSSNWREISKDPIVWKSFQQQWVSNMDVAWSSGRQLALPSH